MPLYEYHCDRCNHEWEDIETVDNRDLMPDCPNCVERSADPPDEYVRRLISLCHFNEKKWVSRTNEELKALEGKKTFLPGMRTAKETEVFYKTPEDPFTADDPWSVDMPGGPKEHDPIWGEV